MTLLRYRPGPPLDRHVECLWWSQRTRAQEHCEHMLPSGSAQLIFALQETPFIYQTATGGEWLSWSGGIVRGPQSGFYIAGPKAVGGALGVSFRPGGAGAVLGLPLAELTDCHVPLDAIWGSRGVDLQHRLISASTPQEAFRLLERSLIARIRRPLLMHPAVAHALALRGDNEWPARVADAQHASGYSPRHFIALFRSAVGLKPKQYDRIRRFNTALREMAAGNHSLSTIAVAAGYSDQSHLARDFREFTGVVPTRYRPSGTNRPLHHRVAAQSAR